MIINNKLVNENRIFLLSHWFTCTGHGSVSSHLYLKHLLFFSAFVCFLVYSDVGSYHKLAAAHSR